MNRWLELKGDSLREYGWYVGGSLTSHSAVFQLYSDGTDVQFPNLDLQHPMPWAARGL